MKPASFTYHRASTVADAVALLGELGDDAKIIAGGQSLVAMMNLRLARPTALVDVNPVRGLSYLLQDGDHGLRVGALTRHGHIERYPIDLGPFGVLQRAARWVGHHPIRTRGTFGGSIAHADPAAEWCILARLLDAQMVVAGPAGVRTVGAADFFQGFLTTALQPDEMLVEVRFPPAPRYSALTEFARRHGDFAIVAAAVACDLDEGACHNVRVALGGVADRVLRSPEAEDVVEGQPPAPEVFEAAGKAAAAAIDPPADLHGTAEYRRFLTVGLVQRAFAQALSLRNGNGSHG